MSVFENCSIEIQFYTISYICKKKKNPGRKYLKLCGITLTIGFIWEMNAFIVILTRVDKVEHLRSMNKNNIVIWMAAVVYVNWNGYCMTWINQIELIYINAPIQWMRKREETSIWRGSIKTPINDRHCSQSNTNTIQKHSITKRLRADLWRLERYITVIQPVWFT